MAAPKCSSASVASPVVVHVPVDRPPVAEARPWALVASARLNLLQRVIAYARVVVIDSARAELP